jgi:hypothetical protein
MQNNIVHLSNNYKSKYNAIKLLTSNNYDKKIKDINFKKLLCNNILTIGKCCYGNNCLYSHSLNEQKMEPVREKAYNIIRQCINNETSNINININDDLNKDLNKAFTQLTKICLQCVQNKCPGGYNCKYGVVNKIYQICYDDLYNNCLNNNCQMVHLSKANIKIKENKIYNLSTNITFKNKYNSNIPIGKLLTENFFLKKSNIDSDSSSDISNESFDRINNFLNDFSSNQSYDESIFIFS